MTVYIDEKYQENVEADVNMIFQRKQRDDWLAIYINICHTKKGHVSMFMTYSEEVAHVSRYPLM